MPRIGKYLLAMNRRQIVKNLSWKDEETAILQLIIDYILISCIVSFAEAEGMTIAETNRQNRQFSSAGLVAVTPSSKSSLPMSP